MNKKSSSTRQWLILAGIVAILVSLSFAKAGLVVLKSRLIAPLAIVGVVLIVLARLRASGKSPGKKDNP